MRGGERSKTLMFSIEFGSPASPGVGGRPLRDHRCLRNKRPSKPFEFIRFGAMDVSKPNDFIGFGDIHGPKPYESIRFRWAFISQTPVVQDRQAVKFKAILPGGASRDHPREGSGAAATGNLPAAP